MTCSLCPISRNVGEESVLCFVAPLASYSLGESATPQTLRSFISIESLILSSIWWSGLRFQLWLPWLDHPWDLYNQSMFF